MPRTIDPRGAAFGPGVAPEPSTVLAGAAYPARRDFQTSALVPVASGATLPTPAAAARLVRKLKDPYQRGVALERRLVLFSDQPESSTRMMQEIGPELLAETLAAYDPTPAGGRASSIFELNRATVILVAAYGAFDADDLARLLGGFGGRALANLAEYALIAAGHPRVPGSEFLAGRLALCALALGKVADAFGPDHAALRAPIEELMTRPTHEFVGGDQSRAQMAAWLVARSGSEPLKRRFVTRTLATFRPKVAHAPDVARSIAMVIGAMATPNPALAELAQLPPRRLADFLGELMAPGRDALAYTGDIADFGIHRDIHHDVMRFLGAVATFARERPTFSGLGFETFRQGVIALDNPLWRREEPLRLALTALFETDPGGLIRWLAGHAEPEPAPVAAGSDLLTEFLDLVALRQGGAAAQRAVAAIQDFLGAGARRYGALDRLADNVAAERDGLRRRDHLTLARDVGFLLGALRRSLHRAVVSLLGHDEREQAVTRMLGALAEELLEASNVAGAYRQLRLGTAKQGEVHAVFTWLSETFCYGTFTYGGTRHDRPGLRALADAVLTGPWHPLLAGHGLPGVRSATRQELRLALEEGLRRGAGSGGTALRLTV